MWIAPNKDHYNLQTADRYDGIEVFQSGSIIIHRVQHNDSGIYVCVATNTKGSVEAKTMLTVKDTVGTQTPPPVSDRMRVSGFFSKNFQIRLFMLLLFSK